MTRSCNIGVRIPLDLIEKIDKSVQEGKFPNTSEAIRSYVILGMRIESFKSSIKNLEFLKHIDELKKGNQLIEWVSTLKENELEAIQMAVQMERDGRYKQQKLI